MTSPSPPPDPQQAVDALAARLLALAALADEASARTELALWSQRVGAFSSLGDRTAPIASIVASMLWTLGKRRDAFLLAAKSVRSHGADDLNAVILDDGHSWVLRSVHDAIEMKRPDIARAELAPIVASLGGALDTIEGRAALELLSCVERIDPGSRGITVEGSPTLLDLGIWGDRFIEAAARTVLSCCLAPGNVPALARLGTVILHIHTRSRDVERIRSLPIIAELSRYARIEIAAIPESLFIESHVWGLGFWQRNILSFIEYDSLTFARSLGADMICLVADLLLSDGCLSAAKEKLAAGHEIVLTSALRADAGAMRSLTERYRKGLSLDVPRDTLYRLSLETMHPALRRQFMRPVPQSTVSDPYQVFFTVPGGFAAHAFHWHPVAFSTRSVPADIGFDSHTIDGRFASDLLAGKDRDAACYLQRSPPDDFYLVSLDASGGVEAFGAFEVSPAAIVQSLSKWVDRPEDIAHFAWLLRQRAVYRVPPDLALDLPADCLDEESAIAATVDLLAAAQPQLLARIARFARAPAE